MNQEFSTTGDLVFLGIVTSDWRPYWFLLFWVGGDTDIYWVEAKFDAENPTVHETASHNVELSGLKCQ